MQMIRAIKFVGLAIALTSTTTFCYAENESQTSFMPAVQDCSGFSQSEKKDCLAQNAIASEKMLTQAEQKIVSNFAKWDESPQFVNKARVAFTQSTKAFVQFRNAQCAYASALGGGSAGNTHEILRLTCVAELNSWRTEQLLNGIAKLPLKKAHP
jgi:uncharacterized protein YecT (DUF1311 family)